MGYEVLYHYYEKSEDGYNKDEVKDLQRKVGEPFEDVPLEVLAQKIMAQMARRDIWILPDVEIYELKKQKVSFRETKGGVIIKNKKFLLDTESNNILVQDLPTENITPIPSEPVHPHNQLVLNQQQQQLTLNQQRRPIKFVVVDDAGLVQDNEGNRVPIPMAIKRKGLQFRTDQRYPVFQEMDDPRDKRVDQFGNPVLDRRKVYLMWDDQKREVTVSQDYFAAADIRLERSVANDPWDKITAGERQAKLVFDGEQTNAVMPELRRK